MSNIEAANALLTAINFDRFSEIEAWHNPDVVFHSFLGPKLRNSVAVGDWHREWLRDYADCTYTETEFIEQGDLVAVRATIEAKGYDWRAFTQRVVDVIQYSDGGVAKRRLYAMLPDLELDKAQTAAIANATGFRGGSISATKAAIDALYGNALKGDIEATAAALDPKPAYIDTVYEGASEPRTVAAALSGLPRPAFGLWRVTGALYGEKDALVELAIDPQRPRTAHWVRIVDGKVAVIEAYWMLREIGVHPSTARKARPSKQVILPK